MADINIGGGSNVSIPASTTADFYLTGLDSSGKVLSQINARIIKGLTPTATCTIYLPTIASLNYRNVLINIDANDFVGTIIIKGNTDLVNGLAEVTTSGINKVTPVQVGSSNNWVVPALDLA